MLGFGSKGLDWVTFNIAAILSNLTVLAISTYFLPFVALASNDPVAIQKARHLGIFIGSAVALLCVLAPVDPHWLGVDGRFGVIYAATLLIGFRGGIIVESAAALGGLLMGIPEPSN